MKGAKFHNHVLLTHEVSDVVGVVEIESRIEGSRKVGEEGDERLLNNGSAVSA